MNQDEVDNEVYFRIHVLLVVLGVACYLTAIAWLIWRIVVGGAFELALGIVVISVLLCVMSTACGCAAVIAWEGRSKKANVKPLPAHPSLVSAGRWTIQDPLERRRPS